MKRNLQLLLLLIGVLLTVSGTGILGLAAPTDNTVTIAIRNWDYDTLDPHVSTFTQSWWMINHFTDTLVYMGPDGGFSPALASSWEAIDGGKEWVFHLRDGVTFHDGTPWNAQALVDNFGRILDPETNSLSFINKLKGLQSTEIIDALTIKLVFEEPNAGFLLTISQPGSGFISPTAFNDPANVKSQDKLKGTGPFILSEEVYQQRVTMRRNPDYAWGPDFMDHQDAAYLDELVWRFIPEDETRLVALLTGEVDAIAEVPSVEVETLEADPGFQILFFEKPGIGQVYHLNSKLFPTDELAVRQAINYAIDQDTISEVIFKGLRPPSYGLLMRPSPYYNWDIEDMYSYDPEKAIEVLEAAGWVDPTGGGTGTRVKDGKLLSLNFVTYPGFVAESPAEMAQAMLRKVGIQMNITVLTGGAMMQQAGMVNSVWNSCVCGDSMADIATAMYWYTHSDMIGMFNFAHYSTPEIDALIDTAFQTTDEAEKDRVLKEVQRIWMEQALCAPTVAATMVWGANSSLGGVKFLIDGTPSFYDAKVE